MGKVFENEQVLIDLCVQSGGHMRNVVQLVRFSLKHSNQLPITNKALKMLPTQRKVQEKKPTASEVYIIRATLLRKLNRFDEAIHNYGLALAYMSKRDKSYEQIERSYEYTFVLQEKYQKSLRRKLGWYVLKRFVGKFYRILFISCPKQKIHELIAGNKDTLQK